MASDDTSMSDKSFRELRDKAVVKEFVKPDGNTRSANTKYQLMEEGEKVLKNNNLLGALQQAKNVLRKK